MRLVVLYIFILVASISTSTLNAAVDYRKLGRELEKTLQQRQSYFDAKVAEIEHKEQLLLKTNNKRERFEICYEIFDLSRSYNYEIAYKYANEALNLAIEIGDADMICQAMACKISSLTSGGLFTEAADIIRSANTYGVSDGVKRELFYNIMRHYSDRIDYANDTETEHKEHYNQQLRQYADSIIDLSPTLDYYHAYAKAYRDISLGDMQSVADELSEFYRLNTAELSQHHNAITAFLLGNAYFDLGDTEQGFDYMSRSVEHDVKAAARENCSIKAIAQHLFEQRRVAIAEQLINVAYDDATFYNARHRNLEINTLLPIINEQRIATISRQRNILYAVVALALLLCVAAVIEWLVAHRQGQIIRKSRNIIAKQLEQLSTINTKLRESDSIKEYYIVESLHKKNEQIEQIESLLRKIDIKVKNRLYDDLKYIYKDFNIKRERANFYSDFDNAFLKLFPNFIEEYNSLFAPDEQIDITTKEELSTEVRIYALMRLGITDNERIARFLDLSINTVYTYKTKVKNKSLVANDEFDSRILQIKLSAL